MYARPLTPYKMQLVDHHQPPAKLLELVGRRYAFLTILDTGAYDKRALEARLEVSRSTVDRALRALETEGLVQHTESGYRTTLYGSTVSAIYDALVDHLAHVERAKPLLAYLPPDIDFNIGLVIDAEMSVAAEPALHAPAGRIVDLVETATDLKGLAYAHTSPEAIKVFKTQVLTEGMPADIVFRQAMYDNFTATHPDVVDALVATDHYTAWTVPDLPFGLFLLTIDGTTHVCLIVYDGAHTLKGIIVNDSDEAVAWGTQQFEYYRARATPITA